MRPTRIAVQPIQGQSGAAVRERVVHLLRSRGFRVVTSLDAVSGTAQYPGLARDHDIAAFVVGGIEEHRRSRAITFLVWNGRNGSVAKRWSIAASPDELPGAVSRGFWPRLGRTLALARSPVEKAPTMAPARPMRIDAADQHDESIVSDGAGFFRRRLPVRD